MTRHRSRLLSAVPLFLLALACGGSDSNGPGGGTFPSLPSALLNQFCVRGNRLPGQATSGTITDDDCDAADVDPTDEGYYEVWRVRVETTRTYDIRVTSGFDSYLVVLRLDGTDPLTLTPLAENDDRIPGVDLDAEVMLQLSPGVDYMVSVSGYDYSQTGAYSLTIQ